MSMFVLLSFFIYFILENNKHIIIKKREWLLAVYRGLGMQCYSPLTMFWMGRPGGREGAIEGQIKQYRDRGIGRRGK